MKWDVNEWNRRALEARDNRAAFDRLAYEQQSFIRQQAYHTVGHYITDSDEEWSVSLLAFYEAVQTYQEDKGNFRTFAAMVIRRRLIDSIRRSRCGLMEIPVPTETLDSDPDEETLSSLDLEVGRKAAEQTSLEQPGGNPLREEIEAFRQQLNDYGISFSDLPESSPRSGKTKENCREAVRAMLEHRELILEMEETGKLPLRDLEKISGIPRKKLERHRRYIVAVILILRGDYPQMAEYVKYVNVTAEDRPAAAVPVGLVPEAGLCILMMLTALQ